MGQRSSQRLILFEIRSGTTVSRSFVQLHAIYEHLIRRRNVQGSLGPDSTSQSPSTSSRLRSFKVNSCGCCSEARCKKAQGVPFVPSGPARRSFGRRILRSARSISSRPSRTARKGLTQLHIHPRKRVECQRVPTSKQISCRRDQGRPSADPSGYPPQSKPRRTCIHVQGRRRFGCC